MSRAITHHSLPLQRRKPHFRVPVGRALRQPRNTLRKLARLVTSPSKLLYQRHPLTYPPTWPPILPQPQAWRSCSHRRHPNRPQPGSSAAAAATHERQGRGQGGNRDGRRLSPRACSPTTHSRSYMQIFPISVLCRRPSSPPFGTARWLGGPLAYTVNRRLLGPTTKARES